MKRSFEVNSALGYVCPKFAGFLDFGFQGQPDKFFGVFLMLSKFPGIDGYSAGKHT
jgi:hypothetical protein